MKKLSFFKKLNSLDEGTINKLALFLIILIFIFYFVFSFFRDASADETEYLHETIMMTEVLKKGEWFANYATGLHGFLFKLPIALVFLFTPPSVFIATLFTILLSTISCWLFYKLLYKYLKFGNWALAGTLLLATNFEFFRSSISFLREIPVLFTVLLFLNAVFSKKNRWIIGLTLLLMLDAKEHVFFTIAPAFIIWIILEEYLLNKGITLNLIKNIIARGIAGFLPSIIFLIFMFCSGLIPLNMFNASILGLTKSENTWASFQFSTPAATANLMGDKAVQMAQIPVKTNNVFEISFSTQIPTLVDNEKSQTTPSHSSSVVPIESSMFITTPIIIRVVLVYFFSLLKVNVILAINLFLAYLGKILYPRTFSFISVPMIIVMPSFITSLYLFKEWIKKKQTKLLIFPVIMWIYFLIFIVRISHGRYLFSIVPIILVLFIIFLKGSIKNSSKVENILKITLIFVIGTLFFESSFLIYKIVLNSILFISLICFFYIKRHKKRQNLIANTFIIIMFGLSTLLPSIAFSYTQGQISEYRRWGRNREIEKIISYFNEDEKIWFNGFRAWDHLLYFYRKDLNYNPQWKWELEDYILKKYLLITPKEKNTFIFSATKLSNFKELIQNNNIDKLALIYSTISDFEFPMQEKLIELKRQEWLKLTKKVVLKNKILYIFDVKPR